MLSSSGMYHSSQTQVCNKHHFISFIATWFRPQAHIPQDWRHILSTEIFSTSRGGIEDILCYSENRKRQQSLVIVDAHTGQVVPWGPKMAASLPCTVPWNQGGDALVPRTLAAKSPYPTLHSIPNPDDSSSAATPKGPLIQNYSHPYCISPDLRKFNKCKMYGSTI